MRFLIVIFCLLYASFVCTQNLVTNGSFENHTTACPTYIHHATGWNYFTGANIPPLFFHGTCASSNTATQAPRTGNTLAYFFANCSANDPFEYNYIKNQLSQPLEIGKTYYVEFYVSLVDDSRFAINDIGLFFSTYTSSAKPWNIQYTSVTPQISSGNVNAISDTANWVKVSGCYTADSSYSYITIGNFNPNTTLTQLVSPAFTYEHVAYYVDDVSIIEVDHLKPTLTGQSVFCDSTLLTATNLNPNYDYEWSTGDTTDEITITSSGVYWVRCKVGDCFIYSDTLLASKLVQPYVNVYDDTICDGQDIQITVDAANFSNILWSTEDQGSQITITSAGKFWVTASNMCYTVTDTFNITHIGSCYDFYAPNSFTPNGDGVNDIFYVSTYGVELFEMNIFNRWGELMHTSQHVTEGWDGTYNNKLCPIGLYVWKVKIQDVLGQEHSYQGHINVIR